MPQKPNIVRDRLVQAMLEYRNPETGEATFTRQDGDGPVPNKRALARHLCKCAGDDPRDKLENWEQNVFRWTRDGKAVGMSIEMAEFVAECLNLPADALAPETIYQEIVRERDRLREQVEMNSRRIDDLERFVREYLDADGSSR